MTSVVLCHAVLFPAVRRRQTIPPFFLQAVVHSIGQHSMAIGMLSVGQPWKANHSIGRVLICSPPYTLKTQKRSVKKMLHGITTGQWRMAHQHPEGTTRQTIRSGTPRCRLLSRIAHVLDSLYHRSEPEGITPWRPWTCRTPSKSSTRTPR